mgnify:CR=1 FL=1
MVWRTLLQVLRRPAYAATAISITLLISTAELLIGSYHLIFTLPASTGAGVSEQLLLTRDLLFGAAASHGWWGVAGVISTSALLGIVVTLLLYIGRHKRGRVTGAVSLASGGSLAALIGLTCLACGPLLFGSLFATGGAAGILYALPLHGLEFTLIALALLGFAIFLLARVIAKPLVCHVKS